MFAKFNGKILSVDGDTFVLAGEWEATHSVLIEYPSKETALTWIQSEDYQQISKHRNAGSSLSSTLVKSESN